MDTRRRNILLLYIAVLFFGIVFITSVNAQTAIIIEPNQQIIEPNQQFLFNITCIPDQPVKSFELKFSFDPSLMQVNEVIEGNLFSGYQHFPSLGTIDNVNGNVINIFDLILGPGNVSSQGTCVSVIATALSNTGDTPIQLYDVGVTNETGYLPIEIEDGLITIQRNIVLSNQNPSDMATNIPISKNRISIDINHKHGGLFHYSITTNPDIGYIQESNQSNGTKICSIEGLSYNTDYTWTIMVQEDLTGNWTNQTFLFTTASKSNGGGSSGGSTGGGGGIPPPPPEEEVPENTPPLSPTLISGPEYIEPGVIYEFSTSSYDLDDDEIRYRFDWGDNTVSNWSEYVSSNQSISMSHQWNTSDRFNVSICAQDKPGLNSTWSNPYEIICMSGGIDDLGSPPVANFTISKDYNQDNLTVSFNASISTDIDDDIILYSWDFGDGSYANGSNPNHTYAKPGEYIVTLMVMDSKGNMMNKTFQISFSSNDLSKESIQDNQQINPLVFLLLFGLISGGVIIYLYREKLFSSVFHLKNDYLSSTHIHRTIHIPTETLIDGFKKTIDLSKNMLNSFQINRPPLFPTNHQVQKIFSYENNTPFSSIDKQINNNIKSDDFIKQQEINKSSNNEKQHPGSSDPAYTFFHRYSIQEVQKRIDTMFNDRTDSVNEKTTTDEE